ncbi:MAG: histidinol-phosphate transaminase [Bacteroidota bacterium]
MIDIQSLVRKNIRDLKPYSSARDEFQGKASVFIDANENPYETGYNRYPDPLQRELKQKIAEIKSVEPTQIFLGNGSDEAIDLLIRAFCEPGLDNILYPEPTYGMYKVSAGINGTEVVTVDLNEDFDLEASVLFERVNHLTKIIFLCSPNNPSGNTLDEIEILDILRKFRGIVVVDEAYIDFCSSNGFAQYIDQFNNLIILQTFSKAWGLAGIRLGMAFANTEIINVLNRIKPPYNINALTQQEALKSLENSAQKDKWVEEILAERERLEKALKDINVVKRVHPSDANFLLTVFEDAKGTYDYLVDKEIVVRDRSNVKLCDQCLRISVGTPEENDLLLGALSKMK